MKKLIILISVCSVAIIWSINIDGNRTREAIERNSLKMDTIQFEIDTMGTQYHHFWNSFHGPDGYAPMTRKDFECPKIQKHLDEWHSSTGKLCEHLKNQ